MDPLTHILLGATTAQFTARRRVGRDATWVAAVAGDLADVDVVFPTLVAFAGGDPTSLPRWMAHRGLTHSLFMAPVLALAAATIWWLARRAILRSRANGSSALSPSPPEPGFAWLFWATFVAALTHPLLDYCTSYGTQLLSPFSSQRFAADAIGIIDILFTSVLALTLPVCWLVRRRRPGGKAPGRIALAALALLAAYLGTGRLLHDRAIDKALAAIGNEPVVSAEAYPAIGSIFLWRTVVETPTHWHVARVHFLAPAIRQVRLARPVEKPLEDQWHALALAAPQAVEFAWFSGRPMRWEPRSRNGQHVVAFHDMRYAWPLDGVDGLWNLEVTLDNAGNVVTAQRAQPVPTGGRRRMFREVWQELWNP